jgi:hypothetical protein
MRVRYLILTGLLILGLTACNRGTVNDVQRNPEGGVEVTLSLTEQEVNDAVAQALENSGNPLLRNPQVDLKPGQIVITGQHERRDGGGTVSGTVTVNVGLNAGKVQVQITQAQIEGFDLSDARIQQFNDRLAAIFSTRLERDQGIITITALNITEDTLQFTLNARRP